MSSLSRELLYAWIEGAVGTEQVEIAFTEPGVEPSEGDWHPAEWSGAKAAGADARILVGPDGGVVLTDGAYQMWVRVDAPPERPVLPSGLVFIT
ncbi:hypothetical protein [Nonomuraea diastatica]|uniref:Uncharacterized protein n=1 Tax=Nonomuraea diastatica TaxID=1848329 RepID=A0A4R4W4P5_9ACTN|nr:hypothetical protein [Nonomuraea diastatica]TDD11857.1 hypothetical protein E1294_44415 [Nonomuraea diastatica]